MKNKILCILFVSFYANFMAQEYELGVSFGGTNYIGDIGSTRYINPNKFGAAILFKYNWNPRIALKGTYSYLPISGNDADAETLFRKNRGLSFSNTINELALGMEFNFYEYDISLTDKSWTPYISLELAAVNYMDIENESAVAKKEKDIKTALVIPMGLGFKSKLIGNLAFSIDAKLRYTFADDLDYVSEMNLNYNIEGNSSDWYLFTGASLIYTFGRPSCYTKGI